MSETAKSIAKRLKTKGLQRLRYYCEMCKKQCRDDNGFKNHCTTEGHLREMERFSENSNQYIEKFSREFEKSFLDVLSHRHHTKRVSANFVYNELIQDKTHVHMNATKWDSLASFARHLGTTGKCEVDETEKGWFLRWIDPEERAREAARRKRGETDAKHDERRTMDLLRHQRELDAAIHAEAPLIEEVEEDTRPVETGMMIQAPIKKLRQSTPSSLFAVDTDAKTSSSEEAVSSAALVIDDDSEPSWLMTEAVVKINSSKVGNGLKNEKAVILDVHHDHADLILLRTGQDIPHVPSKRLETVIPQIGGRVMVLGLHTKKGMRGVVTGINTVEYKATVKLDSGETADFEFEDITKVFDEASDA